MADTRVTLTADDLIVEPVGLDRVWSSTRRVRVPLDHVRGAVHDRDLRDEPKGWRAPGLHLPNKLAGTFLRHGRRHFWNVSGFDRVVVVTLAPPERHDRLLITVADPALVVAQITAALRAR